MAQANQRKIGELYEQTAADFLISRGVSLIEKNFTCRSGELDLIMQDQQTIIFVEVKYRHDHKYGHAAEMVTPSKMKKLIKAAQHWMMMQGYSPYSTDFRFDVIAIHNHGADINWYKNAITQD
ncbi:YraN family protein [Vibrio sp. RC27]